MYHQHFLILYLCTERRTLKRTITSLSCYMKLKPKLAGIRAAVTDGEEALIKALIINLIFLRCFITVLGVS